MCKVKIILNFKGYNDIVIYYMKFLANEYSFLYKILEASFIMMHMIFFYHKMWTFSHPINFHVRYYYVLDQNSNYLYSILNILVKLGFLLFYFFGESDIVLYFFLLCTTLLFVVTIALLAQRSNVIYSKHY